MDDRVKDQHVYPLEDLLPHNTDDSDCRCDPKFIVVGGILVVVHNSYDGREGLDSVEQVA